MELLRFFFEIAQVTKALVYSFLTGSSYRTLYALQNSLNNFHAEQCFAQVCLVKECNTRLLNSSHNEWNLGANSFSDFKNVSIILLLADRNFLALLLRREGSWPMLSSSESPVRKGLFLGMRKLDFSLDGLSGSPVFLEFLAFEVLLAIPANFEQLTTGFRTSFWISVAFSKKNCLYSYIITLRNIMI